MVGVHVPVIFVAVHNIFTPFGPSMPIKFTPFGSTNAYETQPSKQLERAAVLDDQRDWI
jgi:hypothetical protein